MRWRPALSRYFGARRHVFALALLLVGLPGLFSSPPPAVSRAGLAELLADAAGVRVDPADFVWEPARGVLPELLHGRRLVFLGTAEPGMARDVYRARVRLTPGGQPLGVTGVARLTDTPLADECGLLTAGPHAVFATVGERRVRSVTLLAASSPSRGLLERLRAWTEEGSFTPLVRTDLLLESLPARATLRLDEKRLVVELEPERSVEFDLVRRALTGPPSQVRVLSRENPGASGRIAWLDLARAWFGTRLVRSAGRAYYAVADAVQRVTRSRGNEAEERRTRPLTRPWLKKPAGLDLSKGSPEPFFQRRVLRPDPARPGSRLVLVGLDVRQLELGLQAGSAWPRASAGVPGEGRLPRDPETVRRVVAVFNAGPEAAYDRYAAKAAGRVLTPALAGGFGVWLDASRGARIERFPFGAEVPPEALAFEQRQSALVENGAATTAVEPRSDRSVRRRTALCTARSGELYYAFADALDAQELARGLVQAGCVNALPLATGPERLGFALADVTSPEQGRFELVDAAMDLEPAELLHATTRDFFYVMLRDSQPKAPAGARWIPDGGTQPNPAWLPGILRTELTLGALQVELLGIARGGVRFRLRPGGSEPGARGEPWVGVLADADPAHALVTLELGHATAGARHGLALGTAIPLALKPGYATLVLGDSAPPRILLPGEPVTLGVGEQAVQLPLLADDGDVTERARERGDSRLRSALGVTSDGRVVVATLRHDSSDPLAVALRNAGCRRVVELDRGSHHPAFLGRAGTATPPPAEPKTTTLWVLARP